MRRNNYVWAGVAIFAVSLIVYYIYFLDVSECIVESDGDYYYVSTKHNKNGNSTTNQLQANCTNIILKCPTDITNITNMDLSNFTIPECPPPPECPPLECPPPPECPTLPNITTNITIPECNNNTTNITIPECPKCPEPNITIPKCPEINNTKVGYVIPGVAVLVEPRTLQGIQNVTMNIMENLPKHWEVQIFTSKNNSNFVKTLLKKYVESGKVIVDDTILGNTTSLTREGYNNLLVSEDLWNKFVAEKVLIFQVDSIICKDSQRDIASFLQYDYIGAPWKNSTWAEVSNYIGNGGFSLRSRSKSIEAIKTYSRNGLNEDGFFARAFTLMGANMPSYEEAMQFSVERIFYPTPFAVHRFGYTRFTQTQQDQLLAYCPEIKLMIT